MAAYLVEIGQITAHWPWINEEFEVPQFLKELPRYNEDYPFAYYAGFSKYSGKGIISVMAVHVKLGNMTLEQAVDWIRSVEPKEATEVQPTTTEEEKKVCV